MEKLGRFEHSIKKLSNTMPAVKIILESRLTNIVITVLIIIAGAFGCASFRSNPLTDWHSIGLDPSVVDEKIQADYKSFLKGLPPNEQGGYIGEIEFFDNVKGQHAVSIQVFSNEKPVSWRYALVYDNQNKRIKVIKYGRGWYQS